MNKNNTAIEKKNFHFISIFLFLRSQLFDDFCGDPIEVSYPK